MLHKKRITTGALIGLVTIIILLPLCYFICQHTNTIKLESGKSTTRWVQSQNGNDDMASLTINSADAGLHKLNYTVEKYAEIGIITLPDVNGIFPTLLGGTKIRNIGTLPFADGLTIVDRNKTCYMDGVIKFWKVVSKEDNNEASLVVFRYDNGTKQYNLISASPHRNAQKGLNTFFEETPLNIKRNDILGLQIKKPIASNRVVLNELASILTSPGYQSSLDKTNALEDFGNKGSFSFSALLEAGKAHGEISVLNSKTTDINLPPDPIYGHLSSYKFTFTSDTGIFSFKPSLASTLLNADPYIGLIQANNSKWSPKAFSPAILALLLLLFTCTAWLLLPDWIVPCRIHLTPLQMGIAGILIIYALSRYLGSSFPGLQFVVIVAAFIIVFILPGVIISRYYPSYHIETASGRTVLALILSLVYWLIPSIGLFLVKTSYWPIIAAAIILLLLVFLKQPVAKKREDPKDDLPLYWKIFQSTLWVFVICWVVHTLFSTRFQAESFDTFHHIALASKNFELPVLGDTHTNLYGVTMRTIAPYAYNVWGLLIGMVVKISSLDIGTVYCVGNSLFVLFMFIAQWWLIGLFVDSKKIKILAFAIIIIIYLTRTLAIFAPGFQRSEFNFMMYGPSIHEFFLYAVYIVLGIRAIHSRHSADLFVYCGLSIVMAFFHLEFLFINALVLSSLVMISLREDGNYNFSRTHFYLLLTIILLGTTGIVIKSHLALSAITPNAASSIYQEYFYGIRYDEYAIPQRFYYIFKDLFKTVSLYAWTAVAIWGGLFLLFFPSKIMSSKLFNATYIVVVLMLVVSYNPISDIVFTPIMTNMPVQRIGIYVKPIMFTFAAVIISVSLFYMKDITRKYAKNIYKIRWLALVVLLIFTLLTHKQWLPGIKSTLYTMTYNNGNFMDITFVASLPEFKYLNDYAEGKVINVLVEYPYYYITPALTKTYSYFHGHYPRMDESITEREPVSKKCLKGEVNCRQELPINSVMLVRNADADKFYKIGYTGIFTGRLFTVLKI